MYFWDKHKAITSYYELLSGEVCDLSLIHIQMCIRDRDMINYVKKNGLKIHGFAVYAKKKNLLELYKQDMVSYVQTILQN